MIRIEKIITSLCICVVIFIPAYALADTQSLAAENYLQADANGDGALAYEEFVQFIDLNAEDGVGQSAKVSARGLHGKAFERIDANGDGRVTPDELAKMRQ